MLNKHSNGVKQKSFACIWSHTAAIWRINHCYFLERRLLGFLWEVTSLELHELNTCSAAFLRPHSLSAFLWALAEFAFLLNSARGAVPSFTLNGSNTLEWWQILTCTAWHFSIRNTQQFWIWVTSHCPMLSHCASNDWSGFVRRQSAPVKGR